MNYIFVYGTLKTGERRNHIIDDVSSSRYICDAISLPQLTMYDTRYEYPIVQLRGHTAVRGEIWKVSDKVLDIIHNIEVCAGYERIDIAPCLVDDGCLKLDRTEVLAYVYPVNEDMSGYDVIEEGEW